jgi:hypothetical protein
VSYQFGSNGPPPFSNFNATLWHGGIGVTALDFYTQGDPATFNTFMGTFELRGRVAMAVGNNQFDIEVTNNDVGVTFTPIEVSYWFTN